MSSLNLLEPEVRACVDEVLALGPGAVVAFDADGTVWSGDVGEDFLRLLQAERRLLSPPPGDLYAEYERLLAIDGGAPAFAFCVEIMRGLPLEDVERWSAEMFARLFARRIFGTIRAVLDALRQGGAHIYLVSASSVWSVQAGASPLGLDPRNVLAVGCPLDERGRLTGTVTRPITCAHGKVQALEQVLAGRQVALAFGNSLIDREMLEHAERAVLVAPHGEDNDAVDHAKSRGWPIHRVAGAH